MEGLKEMHDSSAIDRALEVHKAKQGDNAWINDNNALVAKPDKWGRGQYVCTLHYMSEKIGVLYYTNGYIYLSHRVDNACPNVYALTLDDNTLNIPLLKTRNYLDVIRKNFFSGNVRVQDATLQNMLMDVSG